MAIDLSGTQAELTCPSCRRKFKQPLARLQHDPTVVCPGCHQPIKINAANFRAGKKKIDDALAKVKAAFKRLGKKR